MQMYDLPTNVATLATAELSWPRLCSVLLGSSRA
jgi:hypothetical protein